MPLDLLIHNARRMGHDALHTSIALDLVAPVEGRTWTALCCWCLDRIDPGAPSRRLALTPHATFPGGCSRCSYAGADTLCAAIPKDAD